jgi:hypothetical protein
MIDEKVADGYLSFGFGVQAYGLGRKGKFSSTNRKTVAENGSSH